MGLRVPQERTFTNFFNCGKRGRTTCAFYENGTKLAKLKIPSLKRNRMNTDMKLSIVLLLAAGSITPCAMGMDTKKWDDQQKAQSALDQAEQAAVAAIAEAATIEWIAEEAAKIRATDGTPSSPLSCIRQSKLYSRTSQSTTAIPSTPELAPVSPGMTAQVLEFADRALTAANTPEGQAVLKLATRAASSVATLWQADGATAFKAYTAKSTALLQAENPSVEEIDGIIEESFQANRHCVNGAEDVAKWGTHAFEGFLAGNNDCLTTNQIALLKLRQKALDAKK